MPENPFAESPGSSVPAPPADAIKPDINGVPPPAPPASKPPAPSLQELVMPWLIQGGLLAAIWLVLFLGMYFVLGFKLPNALGFATVLALVSTFFFRTLLPHPAETVKVSSNTQPPPQVDSGRDIVETVVFVVVLVLLLKSFVAEAFVIPTGSMAQTLYGYQKMVTCPQCGIEFPVNCSSEVEPSEGQPRAPVTGCTCPNCRQEIAFPSADPREVEAKQAVTIPDPGWSSGDRVLVAKYVYDLFGRSPRRLDVVVFKFPGDGGTGSGDRFPFTGPVKKHVPMNYIKRLIGLPGETIAIHRGKLYVLAADEGLSYEDFDKAKTDPAQMLQLWRRESMHTDDAKALEMFDSGKFKIIRKPPETLLAMMRIVYDNDHQAKDLTGVINQRWIPADKDSSWASSGKTAFKHDSGGDKVSWLRYRHVLRASTSWRLRDQMDLHEGKKSRAEKDSRGRLVIGVGFDLNRKNAQKRIEKILGKEVDFTKLKAGEEELSDAQINKLWEDDIRIARESAAKLFPEGEAISPVRQRVLLDIMFSLGREEFAKLEDAVTAINARDWDKAATELARSAWYKSAGSRAKRVVEMLKTGKEHPELEKKQLDPEDRQLITDFMGYNTWWRGTGGGGENWATDLIVECEAKVESSDGTFVLEVAKGSDRFQASFDVATGMCTLYRLTEGFKPRKLEAAQTRMKGKGRYSLRLANVDDRLTVWVDGRLPFGDGVEYDAASKLVPTKENDLERPVRIGASASVTVSKLRVFRDTYYTLVRGNNLNPNMGDVGEFDPRDPSKWGDIETAKPMTFYVQPEHYLCLGDNSPESSDGRAWGLVPRRLLLGRALLVYYPFSRAGRIR